MDIPRLADVATQRMGVRGSLMAMLILGLFGGGYLIVAEVAAGLDLVRLDLVALRAAGERSDERSEARVDRLVDAIDRQTEYTFRLAAAQAATCYAVANGDPDAQRICDDMMRGER